jgi:hypothetical protein
VNCPVCIGFHAQQSATKIFAAVITTDETLSGPLPSPPCPFTGKNFGTGNSNLIGKSANALPKIALKAKDCVYLQPLSTLTWELSPPLHKDWI